MESAMGGDNSACGESGPERDTGFGGIEVRSPACPNEQGHGSWEIQSGVQAHSRREDGLLRQCFARWRYETRIIGALIAYARVDAWPDEQVGLGTAYLDGQAQGGLQTAKLQVRQVRLLQLGPGLKTPDHGTGTIDRPGPPPSRRLEFGQVSDRGSHSAPNAEGTTLTDLGLGVGREDECHSTYEDTGHAPVQVPNGRPPGVPTFQRRS